MPEIKGGCSIHFTLTENERYVRSDGEKISLKRPSGYSSLWTDGEFVYNANGENLAPNMSMFVANVDIDLEKEFGRIGITRSGRRTGVLRKHDSRHVITDGKDTWHRDGRLSKHGISQSDIIAAASPDPNYNPDPPKPAEAKMDALIGQRGIMRCGNYTGIIVYDSHRKDYPYAATTGGVDGRWNAEGKSIYGDPKAEFAHDIVGIYTPPLPIPEVLKEATDADLSRALEIMTRDINAIIHAMTKRNIYVTTQLKRGIKNQVTNIILTPMKSLKEFLEVQSKKEEDNG